MILKELPAVKAADYLEDGMTVGLGTGSTVHYFLQEVGRRIAEDELTITGVVTSAATKHKAEQLHIPLKSIDELERPIDVTVDGADEVSADFQGIKGGGGALLYEKIVALHSSKNIWIVDRSKQVQQLGAFPLPVEVVGFGAIQLFHQFAERGYHPEFRKQKDGTFFLTDENNFIIDLHLGSIPDPRALAAELDHITGVVEHGLFIDVVDQVLVGTTEGVKNLLRPER